MKTVYTFCILFLVFSGQALAQLKCNYCEVTPTGQDKKISTTYEFVEILSAPGTFQGNIMLTGGTDPYARLMEGVGSYSRFHLIGTGHYKLVGEISSKPGPDPIGLFLYAPLGGDWGGHYAGITFAGEYANNYTGPTIIESGYIACNKPAGTVAIPGDIRLGPETPGLLEESSVWFGADHQLSGRGKVYYDRYTGPEGKINLNGTTQTIAGLETNNTSTRKSESAVVINFDSNDPTSIPDVPRNTTGKAILILDGGSQPYLFGGTANRMLMGSGNGGLEVRVKGTGQRFQPLERIESLTFNLELGSIVEFNSEGSATRTLGDDIIFKGSGDIKKTGGGGLKLAKSTLSLAGGKIWVESTTLQNSSNTNYPILTGERNKAVLQVDAGASFDLYGVNSIFGGLTGGGKVKNTLEYNTLTLEPTDTKVFSGEIVSDDGIGGVVIWKDNSGTQVFAVGPVLSNRIEVAAGTLKLLGSAKLGNGTYAGTLKISDSANPAAVFEHNGNDPQIFSGNITRHNPGDLTTFNNLGIFRQSGSGKSIINGAKDFLGNVDITGGFLGGSGDLSKANGISVGALGSLGGGNGTAGHGATLTAPALSFAAVSSTLLVTTRPDNTPALVEVKTSAGSPGTISVLNGFTVDIVGDNMVGGYLIKCSNTGNLPLPILGRHKPEKAYCFSWDTNGLLMTVSSDTEPLLVFNQPPDISIHSGDSQSAIHFTSGAVGNTAPTGYKWKQYGPHSDVIAGLEDHTTDWERTSISAFTAPVSPAAFLRRSIEVTGYNAGCMATKTFTYTVEPSASLTCDNCSFTRAGSADVVTGTTEAPAAILSGGTGELTGNITLNGNCNFTIHNLGKYRLSGQITGTGPLTYRASGADEQGKNAGITLSGGQPNTYTGLTGVSGGYLICNKTNAVAIPNNVKISAVSGNASAHLWCMAGNQFGSSSVVDFSGAANLSFLHLNGTSQNIAGLINNNSNGLVVNWEPLYRPASLGDEEPIAGAMLNIAVAADTSYIFGGGGNLRRGTTTQPLTINVTGGTQVIENPTANIKEVTFASTGEGTLEFNANTGSTYNLGNGVRFEGGGHIKKTGIGVLALTKVSVLKSSGQIWVHQGTLRNDSTTYSTATQSNQAILRVEAGVEGSSPVFDLWGNNSIFGGLTGNSLVQNNFGSADTSPGGGYNELFLKLTGSHTFSGVIRDNLGHLAPESNGRAGKGGVLLKIEGNNQIQSFAGVNIYTGSTTISSGKLALTGAGQLGNGTYAGVLEISNAAAEASQATFEHNGNNIQTFTGEITATGVGTVKGMFLQSGTGKSILTGTKTFTGNVNITNGFLGGAGRLDNVNSVSLDGTGSLGGGNGTPGNGGTLVLKVLTIKSDSAKLIASSKPDRTPSLLDILSLPASPNVNYLTVDMLGVPNLQPGYLIRFPDNVQTPVTLPIPVTGANNTGKNLRLEWDNVGLWMQPGNGTLTLSLRQGSVCPKGSNPGNSKVTVNITYSHASDLPAADAIITNYFTLSDSRAKSNDIVVSRAGMVITARFDGDNPTDANLPYTIIYNDNRNSILRTATRINRKPAVSISSGGAGNTTCLGSPLVLQGVSKDGTGTIFSQHTEVATVGSTTADLTATATTLAPGNVDFLLIDGDGCRSDYFRVGVVIAAPQITAESTAMCAALNGTGNTTLLSANQDPVAAPALAWAINPPVTGASVEDVTAGDRGARFSVTNTVLTESRQFTIEYTNQAGCKGMTVITVNPNPVISSASPASSVICAAANGVANNIDFEANQDPASASAWIINPAADASIVDVTTTDRLARFSVTNTSITTPKQFTVEYTSQTGCKGTTAITVNPSPVVSASGDFNLAKLCAGTTYANALTVSEGIAGNWAVFKTGTLTATAIASTISTVATASATAGRGNIQAGNTHASTAEEVVFISTADCRSSAIPIAIHPKPVVNPIAGRAYCHDSDIPAFAPASAGTLPEARPTHYQWNVVVSETANRDDINLPDYTTNWTKTEISGFRSPNVTTPYKRDISIKGYNITSGCVSESQVFTITIKQALELEYKTTSPVCSGTGTNVFLQSSLSGTRYTWTVSDNSVGATSQATPSSSASIEQILTNSGNSAVSVAYSVSAVAGTSNNCTATVEIPVMVSPTQSATSSVSGGGEYCADFEGNANTYQTNLIPSAPEESSVEWTYTSFFPPEQRAGVISGNTQKWENGALTAVADDIVLSGQEPGLVYYVFRPFTDCLGAPSDTVSVKIHPVPVAPAIAATSTVCSSSTLHSTNTSVTLDNPAGMAYTWTVGRTNSPDVSGYTEPSREGAVVPTANPTAATGGPIADQLLLAATATAAQTIVYNVTPWRNGCPGKAVSANILVNPLPVVNPPGNRQYCRNDAVVAEVLTGTHGANAFKWSGGLTAGLADQAVYGPGLPAYTAPAEFISPVTVTLSAKNEHGCESAAETTFTLAVVAKPTLTLGTSRTLCTGPIIATSAATKIGVSTVPADAKYSWSAAATGAGAGDIKVVKDGEERPFPFTELTLQDGDLAQKMTAVAGSEATITFTVQPFLGSCGGEAATTTVQVRGRDLAAGITNNSLGVCHGDQVNIKVGDNADGNLYSWAVAENTGSGSVLGYNQQTVGTEASIISDALRLSNVTRRSNVTYHITASRGDCDGALVSHTVFVNPVPVITLLSEATPVICSGAKTAISLSSNLGVPESSRVGYSWTVSANPHIEGAQASTSNSAGPVEQTLINKGTEDQSVTYTVTPHYTPEDGKGSCAGETATVVCTVRLPVNANIEGDAGPKKLCLGDPAITLLVRPPDGATCQWLKDNTAIPNSTGNSYEVQTGSELSATYTVRVTTPSGCSEDSRRVEVSSDGYFINGKAEVLVGGSVVTGSTTNVEVNNPVDFKYTGPVAELSWDFKDNTAVATTPNASHTYPNSGTFLPTLTAVKAGQAVCTKTFTLPALKVEPIAGDPNSSMAFSVFPVPAQDQITIVSEGDDLQYITIRDINGKTVAGEAVNGRKVTLRVDHLASGIYILTVTGTKEVRHLKISKR